jgi:Flp pilus assembly protein TadG
MTTLRPTDRGFVTAWTVALTAACWGLVGLSVDAGRSLRQRSDAFGAAASAARAGAQQIDERAAVLGTVELDERAAWRAADDYAAELGFDDTTVVVDDMEVTVTIHHSVDFAILPGSVAFTVSASSLAIQTGGTS